MDVETHDRPQTINFFNIIHFEYVEFVTGKPIIFTFIVNHQVEVMCTPSEAV